MHVQALKLMVLQDHLKTTLQEDDPPHQEAHIELLLDLLPALVVLPHRFPFHVPEELAHPVEGIPDEGAEVEAI